MYHHFLLCPDISAYVQDVYKVIKSLYGDRRMLEKSLKIAVGASQDRVRNSVKNAVLHFELQLIFLI